MWFIEKLDSWMRVEYAVLVWDSYVSPIVRRLNIYLGGKEMGKKVVLVAFNGEPMCFVHVLLNALDMEERGYEVKVVIEGSATRLANELSEEGKPFAKMYLDVREKGMIDCVCQACAAKMGALEGVESQGLPLCKEMKGHPSLAKYIEHGYEVITF